MEEAQCVCVATTSVAFALVNMPPEVVNQTCCKVNDDIYDDTRYHQRGLASSVFLPCFTVEGPEIVQIDQ